MNKFKSTNKSLTRFYFIGPLMFHPRGLGPRPLRPGMRPFGPRGPPFDPREPDAFFRPPFDDIRPHVRPPFGPMGPPSIIPPESAAPWRNQELPPSGSWPSDSENHSQRDNLRDKKGGNKHPNNMERENRNRGRKSRWTNVSPSGEEIEESKEQESTSANVEEKEEPAKEEEVAVKEEVKEEIDMKEVISNEQKEELVETVETKEEGIEMKKEEEEDCRDS